MAWQFVRPFVFNKPVSGNNQEKYIIIAKNPGFAYVS